MLQQATPVHSATDQPTTTNQNTTRIRLNLPHTYLALLQATPVFGYGGACVFCCAVCLCIKLGACTMQQKLIGEGLGTYPAVRKAVR